MSYIPERGDIIYLEFDPQSGHEQRGTRPALVLSSKDFNQKNCFCYVCPITSQVKDWPFEVLITGTKKAKGVVLADQLRSLDVKARKAKFFDRVSDETLKKVIDINKAILEQL